MDGYAVRASEVASASQDNPVTLPVSGDIPAGRGLPAPLPTGTAMRIMTGAPLPEGADAVFWWEDTDEGTRTNRGATAGSYSFLQAGRHWRQYSSNWARYAGR